MSERPTKSQFERLGACVICICNWYARAKLIGDRKMVEQFELLFQVDEWSSIYDVYAEYEYIDPFPSAYYLYFFTSL